jgi:hypothetical protein
MIGRELVYGTILAFAKREAGKPRKSSLRIVGAPGKTRTAPPEQKSGAWRSVTHLLRPYSLVSSFQRCRGICCLYVQGKFSTTWIPRLTAMSHSPHKEAEFQSPNLPQCNISWAFFSEFREFAYSSKLHYRPLPYRQGVGIVQSVERLARGWRARVRFPGSVRFFSSPHCPDRFWAPLSVLANGYRVLFHRW